MSYLYRALDDLSAGLRSMFGLDGAPPDLASALLGDPNRPPTPRRVAPRPWRRSTRLETRGRRRPSRSRIARGKLVVVK